MATRVQKTVGGGGGRHAGVYNQQAMAGSPSCGAGAGSQMSTPVPGKAAILPPERSLGIADSVESRAAAVGAESPRCFFFYCIAELAIKPCRSSRSNTRGGFEKFHDTCKKETKHDKTNKKTQTKQPKHQHKGNTASVIGW